LYPLNVLAYSENFKKHLSHPHGAGEVAEADAFAEETNPVCGDRLRLSLRLRDEVIAEARFLAYGCAPTIACGSALAEMIEGMSLKQAAQVSRQDIIQALGGLPARKSHAAALAIETLRAALESAHSKS
jgi:nitrogen fixation NifU-like protein